MASWRSPLNLLTALLTLAAAGAVAVTAKRALWPAPARPIASDTTIGDWQSFAKGGTRIGSETAPVTITVFSDIRCHFCRETWTMLQEFQQSHSRDVAIVYRHFPFKGMPIEPAKAGICAARQGQLAALYGSYTTAYDSLPIDPKGLNKSLGPDDWGALARSVAALDADRFSACMSGDSAQEELRLDLADARRLGVVVVPTLLVNDTRTVGAPGEAKLAQLVSKALADAAPESR